MRFMMQHNLGNHRQFHTFDWIMPLNILVIIFKVFLGDNPMSLFCQGFDAKIDIVHT